MDFWRISPENTSTQKAKYNKTVTWVIEKWWGEKLGKKNSGFVATCHGLTPASN